MKSKVVINKIRIYYIPDEDNSNYPPHLKVSFTSVLGGNTAGSKKKFILKDFIRIPLKEINLSQIDLSEIREKIHRMIYVDNE